MSPSSLPPSLLLHLVFAAARLTMHGVISLLHIQGLPHILRPISARVAKPINSEEVRERERLEFYPRRCVMFLPRALCRGDWGRGRKPADTLHSSSATPRSLARSLPRFGFHSRFPVRVRPPARSQKVPPVFHMMCKGEGEEGWNERDSFYTFLLLLLTCTSVTSDALAPSLARSRTTIRAGQCRTRATRSLPRLLKMLLGRQD